MSRVAGPKPVKSFRPSDRCQEMLEKAKKRTGKTYTALIDQCIIFALSHKEGVR